MADETKSNVCTDSTGPQRLDRQDLRNRKTERQTFHQKARAPIVLILDGVDGNYNKGAIFRLCDALMVEKVHFCGAEVEPWHHRFKKSARGTYKWVPYEDGEDVARVIASYRTLGYQIVVAEQCSGSVPVWDVCFEKPVCIILGGELSGVSPQVVVMADVVVELPTMGMANSLNVSMSAGMLVLAAYSQFMTSKT